MPWLALMRLCSIPSRLNRLRSTARAGGRKSRSATARQQTGAVSAPGPTSAPAQSEPPLHELYYIAVAAHRLYCSKLATCSLSSTVRVLNLKLDRVYMYFDCMYRILENTDGVEGETRQTAKMGRECASTRVLGMWLRCSRSRSRSASRASRRSSPPTQSSAPSWETFLTRLYEADELQLFRLLEERPEGAARALSPPTGGSRALLCSGCFSRLTKVRVLVDYAVQ